MMSDGKFTREERIPKSADFGRVYKKGVACRKDFLKLVALANGTSRTRIGFSISSRKINKASSRNRVRRALKETYRLNKGKFKAGFDIVIVVTKEINKTVPRKSPGELFLALAGRAALLK